MKTSPSITTIAAVLPKAQAAIKGAVKDATNPHFKSRYADLTSVIDACKQALNAHGITFLQPVRAGESGVVVETVLLHTSGEWISDELELPVSKNDAQGVGSAITYGRRYGLQAMVGIPAEDDDGNAAVKGITQAIPANIEGKKIYEGYDDEQRDYIRTHISTLEKMVGKCADADLYHYFTGNKFTDEEKLAMSYKLSSEARSAIKRGKQPTPAELASQA